MPLIYGSPTLNCSFYGAPLCRAAIRYVAGTDKALPHSKAPVYYVMKRQCLGVTVTGGHHRLCPWSYEATNTEITHAEIW